MRVKLSRRQTEVALEIAETQGRVGQGCVHLFEPFDKQADQGPLTFAGFFAKREARQ